MCIVENPVGQCSPPVQKLTSSSQVPQEYRCRAPTKMTIYSTNHSPCNQSIALRTNPSIHLGTSPLLGLEVIHIDSEHGSSKELHPSQSRDIPSGIVFDKEGNVADALEFDVLEENGIGGLLQIFGGQVQGLGRIDVFPIFKADFAVQENVNFGRIDFGVGAIVEFGEFDRVELSNYWL